MMLLEERTRLPSLRSCDRAQLRAEVGKVNETAKRIETQNITEKCGKPGQNKLIISEDIKSYQPENHNFASG